MSLANKNGCVSGKKVSVLHFSAVSVFLLLLMWSGYAPESFGCLGYKMQALLVGSVGDRYTHNLQGIEWNLPLC